MMGDYGCGNDSDDGDTDDDDNYGEMISMTLSWLTSVREGWRRFPDQEPCTSQGSLEEQTDRMNLSIQRKGEYQNDLMAVVQLVQRLSAKGRSKHPTVVQSMKLGVSAGSQQFSAHAVILTKQALIPSERMDWSVRADRR